MILPLKNPRLVVSGARQSWSDWVNSFKLIWAAAPRQTVVWASLLVMQGLQPVALVYLTKYLINGLLAARDAHASWASVQHVLVLLLLTAAVMLLDEVLQGCSAAVDAAKAELVSDHIKDLIHRQCEAVDLAFYQSPDYHDRMDQALAEGGNRPLALLQSGGGLIQSGITLVAMSAVLMTYGLWLPVILFLTTLPAFFVVWRSDRQYHRWWQRTTTARRWTKYYDTMLTHPESVTEVRMFGLGPHFRSAYRSIREQLRRERIRLLWRQNFSKYLAGIVAMITTGLTLAWMGRNALRGLSTFGDLALFYQAFSRGQGLMRVLLGSAGQLLSNSLYLRNLFEFLDLKPQIVDPVAPAPTPLTLQEGIEFRNITFSYPRAEGPALENFSLYIPAGKLVAIVGQNGAGKTTLLKLLCRLYDPQSGQVRIDGTDIRHLRVKDIWRLVTILFQFPLHYQATVSESIAMSNLSASPMREDILTASQGAGAHGFVTRLKSGYETMLGSWFGGVDISGGERQRIAMARAYLRTSPIVILDEPTSFMDSWSETKWFENFRSLIIGRTGIIVTHRFTVAMRADIIHVMHHGRVIESGTHRELLELGGMYAESWGAQVRASSEQSGDFGPTDSESLELVSLCASLD